MATGSALSLRLVSGGAEEEWMKGWREGAAGMDRPSPFVESSYAYPAGLWYNIAAFSEEDVGLRNRAGGPSEMMLI